MSEGATASSGTVAGRVRQRGGAALSAVLPGAPQLLAGRWGAGLGTLGLWVSLAALLVLRPGRVLGALAGAADAKAAALAVPLGLVGAWLWSWRDVKRAAGGPPESRSQWDLARRAFSRNRLAVVGLLAVAAFYLVALLAPLLAPFDPARQGPLLTERLVGPSASHLLGTDQYARDVLSRVLYGARVSLSIGLVAVGISVTLGTLLGAVAGYLGGMADTVLMRLVDTVIAFPRLVLLIAIVALFDPSLFLIMVVLGLTQWPGTARLVRGEVLSLREREFVLAARALGYSRRRIILRHVIPNALAPVIVAATLGLGNVIVLEAGLSFLGLGLRPPTPTWGSMVSDGRGLIESAWWLSTFPGLAIVMVVLAFNVVGDGLRDALDPRMRGRS